MTTGSGQPREILVGGARIELQNVQLREDILLDELRLEGGDVRVEIPAEQGAEPRIATGETRVRAMMSEANLNRMVAANLPADAPVRGLHIALLSGRARVSGKALVSIVPFPFSIEATPRVENGVRVLLDCRSATVGVDLPRAVVDILQHRINDALGIDVSTLEVPIWIDEVRCEPGRLMVSGRARIAWPPETANGGTASGLRPLTASGFTASSRPLFDQEEPSRHAIAANSKSEPGADAPRAS